MATDEGVVLVQNDEEFSIPACLLEDVSHVMYRSLSREFSYIFIERCV